MTLEEARTLRISEAVIWAAADELANEQLREKRKRGFLHRRSRLVWRPMINSMYGNTEGVDKLHWRSLLG
jgi:hypothetical protein